MNVVRATKEFEWWLGGHLSLVRHQLSAKHKNMAEDPIPFLRGTFYRWAQLFPEVCPNLAEAPKVLAIGDLHIASFGTWRDGFGRLIWGVDDFDEAYPLPCTSDLVRLGVSAVLDHSEGNITVGLRDVCDVILDGYASGIIEGGRPFVLEEHHKWLRNIALNCLDEPREFWKTMDALPGSRNGIPADARKALESLPPEPGMEYRVVRRIAGMGSLGHPRCIAVADWHGGQIALKAKAARPSACAWAKPQAGTRILYQTILDRALSRSFCTLVRRLAGSSTHPGFVAYLH